MLTVLGNSAMQTSDYETTAFIFDDGRSKTMIDCGPGIVRQVLKTESALVDVDSVIITHCHADHCASYPYLLFLMAAEVRRLGNPLKELTVIAPSAVHEGLRGLVQFCYPDGFKELRVRHIVAPIDGIRHHDLPNSVLTTVPVLHAVPTIGLRLDSDMGVLAYSSDTVYCDEFVRVAESADLLIHEAFGTSRNEDTAKRTRHALATEAGRAAEVSGAKKLVLAHPLPAHRRQPINMLNEAATAYSGPIVMPTELETIAVPSIQ